MRDVEFFIPHSSLSTAAKAKKGVRWMPRLRKAMKDVASCEKPRGGAGNL